MDCCWPCGVDFSDALKASMDSCLCDATLVCNVQRYLEELQQHILGLEQEPRGPGEPISHSEPVSDGEDKCYGTVGPCLAVRPVGWQKVKDEQSIAQGRHPQETPSVTEQDISTIYSGGVGRLGYAILEKARGNTWQHGS